MLNGWIQIVSEGLRCQVNLCSKQAKACATFTWIGIQISKAQLLQPVVWELPSYADFNGKYAMAEESTCSEKSLYKAIAHSFVQKQ